MDVELVFFDQVKEKIERALEDLKVDFVFGGFQGIVVGKVSSRKPGGGWVLCGRSMNAQPESEQLQNFHLRLSQWVSGQGFWFQLRYSLTGGGKKGLLTFHVVRLAARFAMFLLVVAAVALYFLFKQTDMQSYQQQVRASLTQKLGAEEIDMRGLVQVQSQFSISRLAMIGTEDTFFTELEMRNLKCKKSLFNVFRKQWDPGVVTISRVDLGLRAGSDSPEAAEAMAKIYFQKIEGLNLRTIVVNDMSIRWGYSERTRGSIIGSNMRAERIPDGWKLKFKGGTFTQNWLKRLEIEELDVAFDRKGIVIEKALFRKKEGYISLLDVKVTAGERPEVNGMIRLRKMDISSLLPIAVRNFVEGTLSAELKVFGSTNSIEGVGFEGNVALEGEDVVTIRDRIHILRAISVVDAFNNYRRIDFREGSFHMKTHGGKLEITAAQLGAGDLFGMKGSITVRLPTQEETAAFSANVVSGDADTAILNDDEFESELDITLERAAGQAEEAKRQGFGKEGDESLFDKLGLSIENRRLEERGAERLSRSLRYEGEVEISLPKEAFDKAPKLADMYSLRDGSGRILMRVPLEGVLYDLTLKQADEIYDNGSR